MLGLGVAPRHSVLWLCLKIGVGQPEAVLRAKSNRRCPVLVDLANSKGTQAGRPRVMVSTYSGVEVAKEDKVIAPVGVLDGVVQAGAELVFRLM